MSNDHQSIPYQCPICGEPIDKDIAVYIDHTEQHIVDEIKKDHPNWGGQDGTCRRCLEHYRGQMRGDTR